MDREYRLKYCRECQNRAFDLQHGVICKVSGKPADFDSTCPDYKLDEWARKKNEIEDARKAEEALKEETLGMQVVGIKSKKGAGCFIMALAGCITFFTIGVLEVVSLWVVVVFVLGLITFIIGVAKERREKAKNRKVDSALDDLGLEEGEDSSQPK